MPFKDLNCLLYIINQKLLDHNKISLIGFHSIYYSKQICLAYLLSFDSFIALKGAHFYTFICLKIIGAMYLGTYIIVL